MSEKHAVECLHCGTFRTVERERTQRLDPGERVRLEAAARAAADGPYSWDAIAVRTIALYERLTAS